MEENLEQTQFGFEQGGCFEALTSKFSVHVSHQDFGLLQSDVPLICLKWTLRWLPCFLSPLVALNGSVCSSTSRDLSKSRMVRLTLVMLRTRLAIPGRHRGGTRVTVGPFVVGQQVKKNAVFGCDIHLRNVPRHALGSLSICSKLRVLMALGLFEHFGKNPFIRTRLRVSWFVPLVHVPVPNVAPWGCRSFPHLRHESAAHAADSDGDGVQDSG